MRGARTLAMVSAALGLAAASASDVVRPRIRKTRRRAHILAAQPAIDTGASKRATQRRGDRDQRRSRFRVAKAFYGSARQARLRRDVYGGIRG